MLIAFFFFFGENIYFLSLCIAFLVNWIRECCSINKKKKKRIKNTIVLLNN